MAKGKMDIATKPDASTSTLGEESMIYSSHYESLDAPSQKRYREKVLDIGGVDPYALKDEEFDFDEQKYPPVSNMDIESDLIWNKSPFTTDNLGAHRILAAFKKVLGWLVPRRQSLQYGI